MLPMARLDSQMVTLVLTLEPGGEEEGLCWLGPAEAVLALHDHLVPRVGRQTLELRVRERRSHILGLSASNHDLKKMF